MFLKTLENFAKKSPNRNIQLSFLQSRFLTNNQTQSALIIENIKEHLKKSLESKQPIVLAFTAPWCQPCKQLKPHLDELSMKLKDKLQFLYINVDQHQDISAQYKVTGVPTTIFLNSEGHRSEIIVGADGEGIKGAAERFI